MHSTALPLLLLAAATVGFLHSILPDHWVPLAVVARTQHWTIARTARISFLASVGHVLTSIVLAGIIALVGLQFRHAFESQQAHIVGVILVLTGIGFLVWTLTGHGHHHHHDHGEIAGSLDNHLAHDHDHPHDHDHGDHHSHAVGGSVLAGAHPIDSRSGAQRLAAIVVPFGAAASPDLTVLPVALAASAISLAAVGGVLIAFTLSTLATFVVLTVSATIAGYQVKGEWLEEHGNAITGAVLILIGAAVFSELL